MEAQTAEVILAMIGAMALVALIVIGILHYSKRAYNKSHVVVSETDHLLSKEAPGASRAYSTINDQQGGAQTSTTCL